MKCFQSFPLSANTSWFSLVGKQFLDVRSRAGGGKGGVGGEKEKEKSLPQ